MPSAAVTKDGHVIGVVNVDDHEEEEIAHAAVEGAIAETNREASKRTFWIMVAVVVLLGLAAGYWFYWRPKQQKKKEAEAALAAGGLTAPLASATSPYFANRSTTY